MQHQQNKLLLSSSQEETSSEVRTSMQSEIPNITKSEVDSELVNESDSSKLINNEIILSEATERKMTASPASAGERTAPAKSSNITHTRVSTNSTSPVHQQPVRRMKKWEVFPGRNKFFCDGRIMMARQTGILYFTVSLIVITVALFYAFDCRLTLVTEIPYGFFIPIASGLLVSFNMVCLLRTAWSDPGIIPRAGPEEAKFIEKYLQENSTREDGNGGYRPPPRSLDITIKGSQMKLKYCFTCKIFRPPRASHCSLCDNCVENFDHHCPWVGNCVGRRNYKYFYLFVSSLTFLCLFIFTFAIVNLVLLSTREGGFLDALKISPGSVLEIIICFFSVWSVIGLSGFHSYLIVRSLTTNEDIKGTWSKKHKDSNNPFDRGGVVSNCCYTLCYPLPPSMIDRRGYASEESIEAYTSSNAAHSNKRNGSSAFGGTATDQQSTSYPRAKPYPVMDTEAYDTEQASYPRQPQYTRQPTGENVNRMNTTTTPYLPAPQMDPKEDDEPSVTITHHAMPKHVTSGGDSITSPPHIRVSYNTNNSVAYHDRLSSGFIPEDDDDQPGVIIEHLGPVTSQGDTSIVIEDPSNITMLSTDSRTLLLDEKPKENGVVFVETTKTEHIGTKAPIMSTV